MNQLGSDPQARNPGALQRGTLRSLLIPEWLDSYRPDWLRGDVVAGLTAAAVVIPKALAYATIAGLPVQVGLYTVLVPMVIYAV
ncbi:MAG TPA: SulP family inorganic anion transporter, partial [Pseudomonas sp.]|nr:SulP family inorganic anion transporter [Pseudomonas sp.]